MESPGSILLMCFLSVLTATEGVLIEDGHEAVNFSCTDNGQIDVTLMCPGKFSNINKSPYVVIRWYDITDPSDKKLIVTIDNATNVNISKDFDGTAEVTRLSSERLDGSINLTLNSVDTLVRYKVFACDLQALNDAPSVYNRPVYAYSLCYGNLPDVIGGVLCLILSVSGIGLLVVAIAVLPCVKESNFLKILKTLDTICTVITVVAMVFCVLLSVAGLILAGIYLGNRGEGTSGDRYPDVIIASAVCSPLGFLCGIICSILIAVQKPGSNGLGLCNVKEEFGAAPNRQKSAGNVSKKDVDVTFNKGNNHSSPRRRKNSVEPSDEENRVPQPVRGSPRKLPPMPERRQPPPMPPVDTTLSPVRKVKKKKKRSNIPAEQ